MEATDSRKRKKEGRMNDERKTKGRTIEEEIGMRIEEIEATASTYNCKSKER